VRTSVVDVEKDAEATNPGGEGARRKTVAAVDVVD
jgi:hypothetical protein